MRSSDRHWYVNGWPIFVLSSDDLIFHRQANFEEVMEHQRLVFDRTRAEVIAHIRKRFAEVRREMGLAA